MNEDTRDRFLNMIDEAAQCEWKAKVAATKAKFLQEMMRELYQELNKTEEEAK